LPLHLTPSDLVDLRANPARARGGISLVRSTTSRWKTPPTREEKKSEAGVDLLSGGRREPRPPRLTTRQRLVPYPRCPSSIFPARTCCTVCIHASIHQFLQQPTRGAVSEKRPSSCSLTAIASLGVRGCEQAARTLLTRTLTPPPCSPGARRPFHARLCLDVPGSSSGRPRGKRGSGRRGAEKEPKALPAPRTPHPSPNRRLPRRRPEGKPKPSHPKHSPDHPGARAPEPCVQGYLAHKKTPDPLGPP